jgi:hypothetical protein
MPILRQGSLFNIQDLYDLEPTQRFESIFSTIDMDSAIYAVSKKSWLGAPSELMQAIEEGFVNDENVAFDASHFEARDQAPVQEKKTNQNRKSVAAKRKKKKNYMTNKNLKKKRTNAF